MRIESLLSARLFLAPQRVGDQVYFISDLSGRLSLYRMAAREAGSVPQPLLPPHIALQNPHLIGGYSFYVLPALGKILLMLDKDGDENYQPMLIPIDGGFPEPAFGEQLAAFRSHLTLVDAEAGIIYLMSESRSQAMNDAYRGLVAEGRLELLAQSRWGMFPGAHSSDHERVVVGEGYTAGDSVLFMVEGSAAPRPLYGTPLAERGADYSAPASGIFGTAFTADDAGLLIGSALFEDTYSLGFIDLADPAAGVQPVATVGQAHSGTGEFVGLERLRGERYALTFNIDSVSWAYEAAFDRASLTMRIEHVLAGQGAIANGVLEAGSYDKAGDTHVLSYSTATSPTQLYTIAGADRAQVTQHTREAVLGVPDGALSGGEDASYESHDGLRISARMYRPAASLGFEGPRPLVYYIHGGPQGQERPDFAWFSMPLIQFLTLNGFAVFVPNVRGSTGYGQSYMKKIDGDWGGKDRLDHVHAMTQVLPNDPGVDVSRAAVVGRSYGGYMTLTLAARHPELWAAAVDMFGPYNLFTFMERIPETWKPYFELAVGHPERDREMLTDRSPSTHIDNLACPLLIIQGANDPRVVEPESRDLAERLRASGKQVDYLVFENEGHDVLKYENKVRCYSEILSFFQRHLGTQTRSGG